jgi:hypothetical protein
MTGAIVLHQKLSLKIEYATIALEAGTKDSYTQNILREIHL